MNYRQQLHNLLDLLLPEHQRAVWIAASVARGYNLFIEHGKKLYGLLVLLMVIGLSYLPGFAPVWIIGNAKWWLWVIAGLYVAWSVHFASFLQSGDQYDGLYWGNVQGIRIKGNKGLFPYFMAVLVGTLAYTTQLETTGQTTTWLYLVCAFVQLLPLLMGNMLSEQAKRLGPFFTNITLIITAMFYIAAG